MKKSERRVAIALVGVAVWLGGLYFAITGLVYDRTMEFRYGALAIFVGVSIAVIALNLISIPGLPNKKKQVSRNSNVLTAHQTPEQVGFVFLFRLITRIVLRFTRLFLRCPLRVLHRLRRSGAGLGSHASG